MHVESTDVKVPAWNREYRYNPALDRVGGFGPHQLMGNLPYYINALAALEVATSASGDAGLRHVFRTFGVHCPSKVALSNLVEVWHYAFIELGKECTEIGRDAEEDLLEDAGTF